MGFLEKLGKKINKEVKIGQKIHCISPHHDDRTPSMHIYESHAYCFGCHYVYPTSRKTGQRENFTFILDEYQGNVERFHKVQPFFYDHNKIFWMWDKERYCYKICDKVSLMNLIDEKLRFRGHTIPSSVKNNYVEALKRVGRRNIPQDPPKEWVQFGHMVVIVKTSKKTVVPPNAKIYFTKDNKYSYKAFRATPSFFFTNPIPHFLGDSIETPVIEKMFEEWVGKKYVPTLYEIFAYCCLRDMPIHLAFCLVGSGRNGKSVFQRLLTLFLGTDNCVSTELDLLIDNRFESFKLYKKLACQLGETNWGVMKKTSLFKKLVGGDLIGFEKKNKDPFDDYNYAKIIINSNSLPSSEDTSEGFYRRWFIIDFPNQFPEGRDILQDVPQQELHNLALKCVYLLPTLLERGTFTNQGTIEERRQKYLAASNPLSFFLEDCCERGDIDYFVSYNNIYNAYKKWLIKNKKRVVNRKEFVSGMANEGLFHSKTSKCLPNGNIENGWFFDGVKLKNNWEDYFVVKKEKNKDKGGKKEKHQNMTKMTFVTENSNGALIRSPESDFSHKSQKNHNSKQKEKLPSFSTGRELWSWLDKFEGQIRIEDVYTMCTFSRKRFEIYMSKYLSRSTHLSDKVKKGGWLVSL